MKCDYCGCEHTSSTYISMQNSAPTSGFSTGNMHVHRHAWIGSNMGNVVTRGGSGSEDGQMNLGAGTFTGTNIPLLSQKKKNNIYNWSFCSFECLILKILNSNVDEIAEKEFLE